MGKDGRKEKKKQRKLIKAIHKKRKQVVKRIRQKIDLWAIAQANEGYERGL